MEQRDATPWPGDDDTKPQHDVPLGGTALEVLLDDEDWFARLGVAEATKLLPPERTRGLAARARQDVDARVRAAAA